MATPFLCITLYKNEIKTTRTSISVSSRVYVSSHTFDKNRKRNETNRGRSDAPIGVFDSTIRVSVDITLRILSVLSSPVVYSYHHIIFVLHTVVS